MSFRDLTNQSAAVERLERSLRRGRLAHAYLLTGPRGSGKEALARALAQALNCLERTDDSCAEAGPVCDSCRRIAEAVHPDVYWVRPESKSRRITIEQIRALEQAVALKPSLGRVKVGVIVDADCLGEEASNAFLKTLEEPPAQTILVLLSTEPQRLLPTILSRCLRITIGPAAGRRGAAQPAELLALLAKFSTRGPERIPHTYQLLADLTALLQRTREEIRCRTEAEANLERYEELEAAVRERLEEQVAARVEGEYRAARERVLEEMYGWFGDVWLCVEGAGEELLEHPDQVAALRQAAAGVTPAQAAANVEAVEQVRDALQRNIAEPLAFEVGLLKISQ